MPVNPTPFTSTKFIYKWGENKIKKKKIKPLKNNQGTLKNHLGAHPPPRLAWLNLTLIRLNPKAAPSPGVGWKALTTHPMAAISKGLYLVRD